MHGYTYASMNNFSLLFRNHLQKTNEILRARFDLREQFLADVEITVGTDLQHRLRHIR